VHVGDTIAFSGLGGHNATAKSTDVPAGAAAFAFGPDAATHTYKVTKLGTYKYVCTFHLPGMIGSFTAVAAGAAAAPAGAAAATPAAASGSQVTSVPVGGVQTGGGSTAGFAHTGLLSLGLGLLMIALMSTVFSRRFARIEK
jgi:hypothetical protein